MKIVLIYLGRKGAGPEYAIEMAKSLSKYTDVLCIISTYIDNKKNWELLSLNQNIHIKWISTYKSIMGFLMKSCNILSYIRIIKEINKFAPDAIYSPMGHFWEKFIVPYCKCKMTIKTIHDVVLHRGEDSIKYKIAHWLFSYKAKKYVTLSSIFISELNKRGIPASNIILIPHAVFKGYNDNIDRRDFKQYDRFLFFGRIVKYKGIDVLLEALPKIIQKMPNAKLVIAGNGCFQKKELIDSYKENIELHIKWIADNQVKEYFKNIDFVVLPYTHASQSGVIPLAYSFGKPVIATRIGGIPEQVENKKTGILIEPNNVNELADSICNLLSDNKMLKMMKENCYNYATQNTWDYSAKILISNIKEE